MSRPTTADGWREMAAKEREQAAKVRAFAAWLEEVSAPVHTELTGHLRHTADILEDWAGRSEDRADGFYRDHYGVKHPADPAD